MLLWAGNDRPALWFRPPNHLSWSGSACGHRTVWRNSIAMWWLSSFPLTRRWRHFFNPLLNIQHLIYLSTYHTNTLPAFCFFWDILVFGVGDKLNHAWGCRGRKEERKKHIWNNMALMEARKYSCVFISFPAPSSTNVPSFDWPDLWFSFGSRIVKTLHSSSI